MKAIEDLSRRMQGVNLSELARRSGVARDHVTRIAKGRAKDMRFVTYHKLVTALDAMEAECSN